MLSEEGRRNEKIMDEETRVKRNLSLNLNGAFRVLATRGLGDG